MRCFILVGVQFTKISLPKQAAKAITDEGIPKRSSTLPHCDLSKIGSGTAEVNYFYNIASCQCKLKSIL